MTQYYYTAKNATAVVTEGTLTADNASQLYSALQSRGLYCVSYHEVTTVNHRTKKFSNKQLALFCRQLGSMLHAGMSIADALNVMRRKAGDALMKQQAADLYEKLQKGITFSQALSSQEFQYPPIMISMVSSGEVSGQLDQVMNDLFDHFSHENKLHNQLASAMTYPLILVIVTVVIVTFLMTGVLPTFFGMFGDVSKLPWYTKMLMAISNSLISYWYIYILVVLLLIGLFKYLNTVDGYVMWKDRMKIRWPIFGKLNRTVYTARFARTFAALFKSGIPVIEAMGICSGVLTNRYYAACINSGIELVRSGLPLSSAVERMDCFDSLLVSMIYTGEQSGELDGVLKAVGAYYDEEADAATNQMVAALQPILIIVLGLIIGFIMIAVIVPIYSMYSAVL
jgi:type IV pilus assembly protein PilC